MCRSVGFCEDSVKRSNPAEVMDSHGQQRFGAVPESSKNTISSAAGLVIDAVLETEHTVWPLQQRVVEPVLREGYSGNENSPRFTCKNAVPLSQQSTGFHSGGVVDTSSCYKYEDFAGMLGDRLASGSLSDVSASASEKICSGNSSSGEHYGPRVKFMCSFGGRILPRPGDGRLRYVGGDTRIVSISRHSKYRDLMHKMIRIYGQPVLLKYQLPNEDLDALISVSCDEDVENMMEEYDRLQSIEGSSCRLRIFLFTATEYESVHMDGTTDIRNTEQLYMDAINGMPEARSVSMVPISSCSNLLTGQGVPDSWGSRAMSNSSFVLPIVSMSQVMPSLVQPVSVGMSQSGNQVPSRVFSASPSTPSSPTISPHFSQIRQPGPDAIHGMYSDQLVKAPVCHLHDVQRLDAGFLDVKCIRSGASSLNSQPDASYRALESKRLPDSPRKVQHELGIDQLYHKEQMLLVDPVPPKVPPSSGLPQSDVYEISRVSSSRSLMGVQQQQVEIVSPSSSSDKLESHPAALLLPLDIQSPVVMQDQGQLAHLHWKHAVECRREGAQRLEPLQIPGLGKLQNFVASQQAGVAETHSPVVMPGREAVVHNQLDQSAGGMSGDLFQKPFTLQTSMQLPTKGQVSIPALYPGSSPSSPRVKFPDMNMNYSGLQYCQANQGGMSIEQQSTQLQLDNEPAFRGLKPLNTRLNAQEELLPAEEQAARKQLPPPVNLEEYDEIGGRFKQQDPDYAQGHYLGGFKQQDADYVQSHYLNGFARPKTPPYHGDSPYYECLTPFSYQKTKGGVLQEHVGFAINPNYQEEVDFRMKNPMVEDASAVWTHKANAGEDSSLYFGTRQVSEITSAPQILETPLMNPSATSYLNPNVPSKAILTSTAASSQLVLDGIQNFSPSMHLASSSETGLGNSFPVGAPPKMENQHKPDLVLAGVAVGLLPQIENRQKPALVLASSPVEMANSKSFFAANTEEVEWIKRVPANPRTAGQYERNLIGETFNAKDGSCLGGRVNRPTADTKFVTQDEALMYAGDGGTTVQFGEAPHMNMQAAMPSGMSHCVSLETSPLSTRISQDSTTVPSPSLSFVTEPSTGPSCLAEATQGSSHGNLGLHNQRQNSEVWRPEILSSGGDGLVNTQSVSLVTSLQFANAIEGKDDFPVFDSISMEEIEHKETISIKTSAMADVESLPPTLYSAPTLSVQNWEESLATVKLEDVATEESLLDKDMAGITLQAVVKAGGENSVDVDWGKLATNAAAMAEAEAIARGLQTIRNEDLEELCELGTGTFGTVYYGKWRGTDVAIKRIKASCFTGRPSERDRLIADFWREAYILGQLHHPNVVAFYGVVPDGPGGTLATVTEYMVNGSLKQVLQKKDRTIDRRKRLLIILDAAFGMEYLHGKNIVHFDLKCENLLVNMKDPQRPICKVGDLGLSKVKHQTMVSGGVRGTLPWMAPELLNGSSSLVSEKVDVFSFGIVMWELLTGEEPYANMHYGAIIGGIVNNTLRPPIPSWCEPAWKCLMERCWSADPQERPAFLEIAAELRAMATSKLQGQTASPVVSGEQAKSDK